MNTVTRITSNQIVHARTALLPGVYQWHLEPGSQLHLIHEHYTGDLNGTQITFVLGAGSTLLYTPIVADSCTLSITLQLAERSSAQVNGAYAFTGSNTSSIVTRQKHVGNYSTSVIRFNGIATDTATVEYRGMIAIEEQATGSHAHQENKTLLLSSKASALSIPSLEVLTNDVQCGHGSAVGPLQKEHLIYAQSRGISLSCARRLLITSYFTQTLHDILDDAVRGEIIGRLVEKALGE